ncbi:CheY-like chemotaxis protein [Sphingomonas jejuensis]|uniref:CheY-like chemotaxis protein n=1 Tax=Sphingomonas jejuensis TaxID=904715 RepID=A0ABX0XJ21_9SPHN|nr:response regulator [Sphingomonas jejuensis]NJC32844.1 CheY-like chemotaxis protein [Sphingomonas jejuensis]
MCHVLVIEDDWLVGEMIADVARDGGATSIERADTEAQAVACALARPPSVIMSDVRLAEGTGPAAVWQIRQLLGPRPVIFITGTPEECEPCDYAAAILSKPVAPADITRAFKAVVPAQA